MRKNDSLELKIVRVMLPLLIYYGVSLIVQVIFGIYAQIRIFLNMENSVDYSKAYHFIENTERYISEHSLAVTFVAAVITIGILWIIFRKDNRKPVNQAHHLLPVILMGVFASSGLSKLVTLLRIDNIIGSYESVNQNFMDNPMIFQILTLCVVAPFVEELVFRGIMYQRMKDYMDKVTAVLLSSLIFGVYHGNLVQGLYAGILGVLFCFVYEKCGSFAAPVLFHMAANTTALIMMYFPVSTFISEHIILKIFVMLLELIGLCIITYFLYQKTGGEE